MYNNINDCIYGISNISMYSLYIIFSETGPAMKGRGSEKLLHSVINGKFQPGTEIKRGQGQGRGQGHGSRSKVKIKVKFLACRGRY